MYAKSKWSSLSLNILAPSLSIVSDTPRKAYYETGQLLGNLLVSPKE